MKLKYVILVFSLLAVSCSQKFDITDHFDPTLPFEINQLDKDGPEFSIELAVDDPKHEKLVSWLKSNNNGWYKSDHDTHAGLIIVRQKGFNILLYRDNDMVVVGTEVKGNDSKQYIRDMDSNELMFLVDD